MGLPRFISDGISFVRDRLPPLSHVVATVAVIVVLVIVVNSMTELGDDPLRYPGRDYNDEARVAKRKAAEGGENGYYFNYEGNTYFQPATGGRPYYVAPANPEKAPAE